MSDEPKKSHQKKKPPVPWHSTRAKEKAELFYIIYEQMGTTRTLKRLWGLLRGIGISITLKTLENYSAPVKADGKGGFGWQARVLERAARHESAQFVEVQNQVDRMNADHVQLFQDIEILVKAGIQKKKEGMKANATLGLGETLDMEYADITRMAESVQRGERLARGLATSKAEVIIEVLPPLVKDIYAVFMAVNSITNDPPELLRKRQAEFIQRADQVLMTYYTPAGKQAALIKGKE